MKTTRLVVLAGLTLFLCSALRAQVKIGDNPLQISDNRLLEIENANEYFLVKDTSGMTIGRADNLNDPLMLKLFGYGESPSLFAPGALNGNQDYFLGTNSNGEVLEFPLSLDLNRTTNIGELSFNNGDILFGSVQLDSVFSTDTQLTDSLNVLRTLVASSEASDGDTITGNEWISNMQLVDGTGGPEAIGTRLEITENLSGIGATNTQFIDLGFTFATDIELGDSLLVIRNELADTAAELRRFNFYLSDNTFDDPTRTASGGGITNLTFDSLSQFNVTNTPIINLNSTTGDIVVTSDDSNVDINASSGTVDVDANLVDIEGVTNINLTASDTVSINGTDNVSIDGNVQMDDYGQGSKTGTEAYLLGVDAAGNVLDVDVTTIGGDAALDGPVDLDENGTTETTVQEAIDALEAEIDSTIYNYDGVLTSNRNLDGNSLNLTFDNLGTYNIANTATFDIDATAVDMDGTTLTADYTTSNITTTGINTIESTGDDVNIISNQNIELSSTDSTIITASNANISTTGNTTVETSGFGVSASSTITIDGQTTSLIRSNGVNSIQSTSDMVAISSGTSTDVNATTNINLTASDTVSINGTDNVSIDGNVQMDDYGQGSKTGTEAYLLGVDAAGNVLDVDVTTIGGDAALDGPVDLDENGTTETTVQEAIDALEAEIDSTIYNYDGILSSERTMDMNGFGLTFEGDSADPTQNIYLTSDGRMAIGRNTVTAAVMSGREIKLDVAGDILAVQVHSSSDRRFKKNIAEVENALERILQLRGVTYDFRTEEFSDRNFPETSQLGFIAQEIEEVMPEVVRTDNEGFKAVDYAKLTALLTEAIKDQNELISAQEKLINSQKEELNILSSTTSNLLQEIKEIRNVLKLDIINSDKITE